MLIRVDLNNPGTVFAALGLLAIAQSSRRTPVLSRFGDDGDAFFEVGVEHLEVPEFVMTAGASTIAGLTVDWHTVAEFKWLSPYTGAKTPQSALTELGNAMSKAAPPSIDLLCGGSVAATWDAAAVQPAQASSPKTANLFVEALAPVGLQFFVPVRDDPHIRYTIWHTPCTFASATGVFSTHRPVLADTTTWRATLQTRDTGKGCYRYMSGASRVV